MAGTHLKHGVTHSLSASRQAHAGHANKLLQQQLGICMMQSMQRAWVNSMPMPHAPSAAGRQRQAQEVQPKTRAAQSLMAHRLGCPER